MAVGCAAWLPGVPLRAAGEAWKWEMPGELYKRLNHLQRSRIDKAAAIFKQGEQLLTQGNPPKREDEAIRYFRVAALEFKKIRVQAGDVLDDPTLAYVIFMEGYSHHGAFDRFKAVRTYTEVVDYFPNEIWIVVPALHFRGVAQMENGDDRQAYASFLAITEDDDYRRHPLAAGALRRLADNHWANQQFDEAAKFWLLTWESFHKTNEDEAREAADKLKRCYIFQNQFAALEKFLYQASEAADDAARCEALCRLMLLANDRYRHNHWMDWYYARFFSDSKARTLKARDQRALLDWFTSKQPLFESADRTWDFRRTAVVFSLWQKIGGPDPWIKALIDQLRSGAADAELTVERGTDLIGQLASHGKRPEASRAFEYLSGSLRSSSLAAERKEELAEQVMGTLAHHRMPDEARSLLDLYVDRVKALWAEYRVAEAGYQWDDALATLDKLEAVNDPKVLRESRQKRAWIYKDHTREFDKAVAVFQQIADPPTTLWQIQECYRAAGKNPQAHNTLAEIAGSFPKEAPRAVFTQAEYRREDGEHKLAVALYRQILMRFKDSPQSSTAHQRLEDYGVESGGGVIDPLD